MQTLILSLLSGDWEEEDDDLRAEQFSISKIVKLYLVVIVIGHYYSQITTRLYSFKYVEYI